MDAQRWVVVIGLVAGAVFGIAGGALPAGSPAQGGAWLVSSVGLVAAAALLAARHQRAGRPLQAAGFLVLVVAETMLWAGGMPETPGYEASFAFGVAFYAPAFWLVALGRAYPLWGRVGAALVPLPFLWHTAEYVLGRTPPEAASGVGYGLLLVPLVAWILAEARPGAQPAPDVGQAGA